jgi:hypothetical protein
MIYITQGYDCVAVHLHSDTFADPFSFNLGAVTE